MILQGWGAQKPELGARVLTGHPLAQGLAGAYLLNEGAGVRVGDAMGLDGELTNSGLVWQASVNGVGLYGNATGKYANRTSVPYSDAVSFIARFKYANTLGAIAAHHTTDGVKSNWFLFYDNGAARLKVDVPWGATPVTSTGGITSGESYTVGFSRWGAAGAWNYTLYINGILDTTVAAHATDPATSAQTLALNNLSPGNLTFAGIGDIAWAFHWNRALRGDEHAAMHVAPYAMFAGSSLRTLGRAV